MLPWEELKRYDVVLGSASPRRKEILTHLGIQFRIRTSSAPERSAQTDPARLVEDLARQKSDHVLDELRDEGSLTGRTLLVTADTVVVLNGRILGKPSSESVAREMIEGLQGHTHTVLTGLCLRLGERIRIGHEATEVEFAPMSDEEIRDYLASQDYRDKAGAYGIQSKAAPYIRKLYGDYYNVVGFPVRLFYETVREILE